MITGRVTSNREAMIELPLVGSKLRTVRVEAAIDTGFNGYLTLPSDLINRLQLQLAGNRRATLGDGNVAILDAYLAKVFWHGQNQEVLILQTDGGPLVGMSLLYGCRVTMDVVDGGDVTIEPLQ